MSLSAIDLGFLYTKGIVNGKRIIMKSVIGDSKKLIFRDLDMNKSKETDDIAATVNGQNYFVSDLAISQSDSVVHSLKPNRFNSSAMQVLVSSVLGLGFGSGSHLSYFVSGLPASQYSQFKSGIQDLILNKSGHDFDLLIEGKDMIKGSVAPIQAKFIPQPFGAGMDLVLDNNGTIADKILASRTVAIIDPGFGTTDIFVMNSLSPVEKLSFSTPTAMNHAYKLIANKIEENFSVLLPLYKIEEVVITKKFSKSGKDFDMKQIIDWAFRTTAEQLISEIFNKWKNIHEIDYIYISGGGGIALSPYLLSEFENINLMHDSQWAVARGYYKWGRRSWRFLTE
jgi:plasmid segregation protein ParM